MSLKKHLSTVLKIRESFGVMSRATYSIEKREPAVKLLEGIFLKAVESVLPQSLVRKCVKNECDRLLIGHKCYPLKKNVHLVGFGKAVLGMAVEIEKILGNHLLSGVLCLPVRTHLTFKNRPEFFLNEDTVIKVHEGAANNLPDLDAAVGAEAIIQRIKNLDRSDILIVLISGGGSALLPKPKEGISLEDKLNTVKSLASVGASINELNSIRKKLSDVKGGGLALLSYPVTTIALILSDVVNDPLDIIGSGPTVPNSDKPCAPYDILEKYDLLNKVPRSVLEMSKKEDIKNPYIPISAKGYSHVDNFIIGNNTIALQKSKLLAEESGFRTIILSNAIESPVHAISDFYVNLSYEICKALTTNNICSFISNVNSLLRTCHYHFPCSLVEDLVDCIKLKGLCRGICLIAGGETTVQVKGAGTGGRNQELALIVSYKLFKLKQAHRNYFQGFDVSFLSAGTDGIDGNSDAAGAVGCANIISRAIDNYIDPGCYLENNDSNGFFRVADNASHLIITGHTGTNVMDLHLLLVRDVTASGGC